MCFRFAVYAIPRPGSRGFSRHETRDAVTIRKSGARSIGDATGSFVYENADLCAVVSDCATTGVSIFQADRGDRYLPSMGMQLCIVIGPGRPQESHPLSLAPSKRVEASSGRDDVGGG
jgi:hypothetical protein